jgi:membrane dipeptidase
MWAYAAFSGETEDRSEIVFFDGHNDAVQFIAEYQAGGRDLRDRSNDGDLDLVRAREGGLIGGMFAMMAKPGRWCSKRRRSGDG